jgi:UTP--glucose-1-phosphate uridylyltransferase
MSDEGLRAAQDKMRAAGVAANAIDVFSHYYRELEQGATGLIREDTIAPVLDPPQLADVAIDEARAGEALARTVMIKLNGGLGTSMGMDRAKSLLPVRDDQTFLDVVMDQVRHARREHGVRLPLILMDSFRTSEQSLAAVRAHPDIEVEGLPLDFLQNQEPKLLAEGLTPVTWPADPSLEWCPPGHGDIYTAIQSSGVLAALLEQGFRYASVSNADNLGAAPSATLAGWFAATGAPYAAEVCRRTPADRKGGHLAIRRSDGRLILRERAQTADTDMDFFADEGRHPYFNSNNLWLDLEQIHAALVDRGSVLGLPLIRNTKTVDPTDPTSPAVVQIETAMGAAIEVFEGAQAIVVGRDRFLPVKTTDDLLVLRSDVFARASDGTLQVAGPTTPLVHLDPQHYRTIADFDARFPLGPPSLRQATSLTVRGDWTFGADVVVVGDVELRDTGAAEQIPAGTRLS